MFALSLQGTLARTALPSAYCDLTSCLNFLAFAEIDVSRYQSGWPILCGPMVIRQSDPASDMPVSVMPA